LLEGQVEIVKALDMQDEHWLGVRQAGSFVGEMSMFTPGGVRSASVRSTAPLRALEMTRADLDALMRRHPEVAYDMVRVLSERLEESDNLTIRDLQRKNRELTKAYQELKAAQAQIIEKEKLEHELELAAKIQMSILPHALPRLPQYDFGARMIPMSAVGGDFYDFIPLGEGRLGVAVGDVSGHGVPAALFMAMAVTLLRAEACRTCSPQEVLRGVNRQLLNLNNEGMFVTVLYGVLDGEAREFTYARAGHEPPLMCRAGGDAIRLAMASGQVLGLFDDPPLAEQTVTLEPDSTLLLYTDGVAEAVDAHAEQFGEDRLQQALCAASHLPALELCEQILGTVIAYCDARPQLDDITLVSVQTRAPIPASRAAGS
jgi:sigma-B regulation protein RsbU (phosphoserine phosphatase)